MVGSFQAVTAVEAETVDDHGFRATLGAFVGCRGDLSLRHRCGRFYRRRALDSHLIVEKAPGSQRNGLRSDHVRGRR
jgi:hypothetical protein